jgi:hypothetical protein
MVLLNFLETRMQKNSFHGHALVALLVGLLVVILNLDTIGSMSVDLAHHYALIFRISEDWHLVPDDPSLGEMNIYPKGSHVAAAVVGMLVGSPFLGMHLVALASLVLLWAAGLAILRAAPKRDGGVGVLVLALLVLINHGVVRLHGAEISDSYFFSQFVAQALAIAALAVAIRLEASRRRLWAHLFLLGAIYVVTVVHLLPALELLGVFAGVMLLDLLRPGLLRRDRIRLAWVSALMLLAGIAIVVLHPSFAAMRIIAANDGGIDLGRLGAVWIIGVMCLLVLASIVPLLRAWQRAPAEHVMYKYFAMYGAAVAGLCLLQMVLRYFNMGSDYAIKKYAFGLATFLFLRIALWIGGAAGAVLLEKTAFARLADDRIFRVTLFGVALFVIASNADRTRHQVDTSDVVAAERQLTLLRDTVLTPAPPGKSNLVLEVDRMPTVFNYMFSLAVTRTPRSIAQHDFLDGTALGPVEQYGVIVSSRGHARTLGGTQCAGPGAGPLALLDPACVGRAQQEARVCKGSFDFSQKGRIDPAMLTGFANAEPDFRWTDGARATFTCEAGQPYRTAKLALAPYVAGAHPRQRVTIAVNGAAPQTLTLDSPAVQVVALPLPPVAPGQPIAIQLGLSDAVTPKSLGLGEDGRRLGVAVTSISFE